MNIIYENFSEGILEVDKTLLQLRFLEPFLAEIMEIVRNHFH